jgi:MEDS: MEthanogen/methylotroph, DcmR Sensory domain
MAAATTTKSIPVPDQLFRRTRNSSMFGCEHFHAVRFYENDASLCRIVATFLREGFSLGQPALVIATREHSAGIVAELRARDLFAESLIDTGDLVFVDAADALASFMAGGVPNPQKFSALATAALERVRRGRKRVTVRAYGEMVDVLWKQGFDVAAIKLEMLWNRLARSGEFSLMCGYAMGNFYKDASVMDVCRQHTHLVHSDGTARVSNADTLLIGAP